MDVFGEKSQIEGGMSAIIYKSIEKSQLKQGEQPANFNNLVTFMYQIITG